MRKSPDRLANYARRGAQAPASRCYGRAWCGHGSMAIKRARYAPPLRESRRRRRGRRRPSGSPTRAASGGSLGAAAGARTMATDHVRVQREHQMANSDSPIARRRSRLAAPRRGMTPRARSSGRRSARWPAIRSSSRERVAVDVRRSPHCEIDENANAAGCVRRRARTYGTADPPYGTPLRP